MSEKRSQESVNEAIIDFCNGLEALAVGLRRRIQKIPPPTSGSGSRRLWCWEPSRVGWEKVTGPRGEYQCASDPDSIEFQRLVEDLRGHGGKLVREGFFYWLFNDGKTVGRKKQVREVWV